MIFLIGKMFVYLLLAAGIGGAAGWLYRNLQAQRTEESANRAVNDAKAKLPQLESLLRGRDEQITKLKEQLKESKADLGAQTQEVRGLEQQLREQERLAKRWEQSAKARQDENVEDYDLDADAGGDTDNLIAELSSEISRLKGELAVAQTQPHTSAGSDETLLQVEVEELRAKLSKAEADLQTALADLQHEQHKNSELERERDLQNKSMKVLHQQLDLERTRRVANG